MEAMKENGHSQEQYDLDASRNAFVGEVELPESAEMFNDPVLFISHLSRCIIQMKNRC